MCKRIIQGILFTGFSIQILLGLAWMCCNITGVQDFAEAAAGFYPYLARLAGEHYPVVYALQLLAAGYAGWRLVRQLCGRGRLSALWGSLALMTLPMAMQCHLALLPYSLAGSAGLLQLSFCCELFRRAEPVRHVAFWQHTEQPGQGETFRSRVFAEMLVCFFVQTLLLPEYLLLGAAPLIAALWLKRKGMARERKLVRTLLLSAAAIAASAVVCAACQGSRETGRENDISGLEWTLVKRLCWPTLWVDSGGMADELWDAAGSVMWESCYYPGNMERLFRPAVEEAMSLQEAKPLFREMAANAWRVHYPMIIRQIGWDVLGYCAAPVILRFQLTGDAYESYSGRNYEIMRNRTPILTKYYVDYCGWWFAVAALLTLVLLAVLLAAGERPYTRDDGRLLFAVLFYAAVSVVWYGIQGAGIMDYKYTVLINQLWFLWSIKTMRGRSLDEREDQRI